MGSGAWRAAVPGVSESDVTEHSTAAAIAKALCGRQGHHNFLTGTEEPDGLQCTGLQSVRQAHAFKSFRCNIP